MIFFNMLYDPISLNAMDSKFLMYKNVNSHIFMQMFYCL